MWLAGAANGAVRWLELTVIGLHVYQQTGSPFLVSVSAALRLLPMALFGPFMGSLAQRLERRRLFLWLSGGMIVFSLGQALLVFAGALELWMVMAGCFLSGIYWSADFPVRRVLLGDVSGESRAGQALVYDSTMNNVTRMLGPMIGGVLLELSGLGGIFLFSFLASAAAFMMVAGTPPRDGHAPAGPDLPRAGALRSLLTHPAVLVVMVITVIFNVFGFPNSSMIPVIGETRLALSATTIGLLASCEGIGATVGSLALSVLARERWYKAIFWGGIVTVEFSVLAFVIAPGPASAATALFVLGLGMAGFTSMQTTLIYISISPKQRSQAMGLVSFCVGAAPLGILNVGLLAGWLGPPLALSVMATAGLTALALLHAGVRRRYHY